jgi:hypothetical protein
MASAAPLRYHLDGQGIAAAPTAQTGFDWSAAATGFAATAVLLAALAAFALTIRLVRTGRGGPLEEAS